MPGKLFTGIVSESGAKHTRGLAKAGPGWVCAFVAPTHSPELAEGSVPCKVFEDKLAASDFGKRFMEEAERRGSKSGRVLKLCCLFILRMHRHLK